MCTVGVADYGCIQAVNMYIAQTPIKQQQKAQTHR